MGFKIEIFFATFNCWRDLLQILWDATKLEINSMENLNNISNFVKSIWLLVIIHRITDDCYFRFILQFCCVGVVSDLNLKVLIL